MAKQMISTFNFSLPKSYGRERVRYAKWVNQVLISHQQASTVPVEEIRICFDFDIHYGRFIDSWFEFASVKRVQRLELDISPPHGGLRNLFLFAGFGSITSLKLKNVVVTNEHIEHLLSNSPVLESLCIEDSHSLTNLRIVGPSYKLKYLEVYDCSQLKLIEISSAIYLVSFKYKGEDTNLLLKNLPQLVEIEMSLSGRSFIHYMASHFSSYLYKLKKLRLKLALECFPYTRRLSLPVPPQKFPELPTFSNLMRLEFDMIMCQDVDPSLVMYILKASPFIHSFMTKLYMFYSKLLTKVPERKGAESWKSYGPYPCLKVVEFVGFIGDIFDIDVAVHLIENATSLEKLIITPCSLEYSRIPSEFIEREKQLTREGALQLGTKLPPGAELLIL